MGGPLTTLTFDPDGLLLAVGTESAGVELRRVNDGVRVRTLGGPGLAETAAPGLVFAAPHPEIGNVKFMRLVCSPVVAV